MTSTRSARRRPGLLCLAVAFVAALAGAAHAQPKAGKPLEKVTLITDWIPTGLRDFGTAIAREKGWYAAEGLDVTIEPGRGSGQVAQVLIAGRAEFGQMLPVVLVQSVARGADLRAVAVIQQKATQGVRVRAASGINAPREMTGKTVGLVPGSMQHLLWPAFATSSGLDPASVNMVNVDQQTFARLFAEGRLDVTNGDLDAGGGGARLRKSVGATKVFPYSDSLPMIGQSVVVRGSLIKDKPEVVRAFLRATQRGWEYLLKNPREALPEAARIVVKSTEGVSYDDVLEDASAVPIQILRPSRAGKAPGWSDPEDWKKMIAVIGQAATLAKVPAPEQVMTNDLLP